jgi:hypothetical protein
MFKLETAESIKKQIAGIGRAGVRLIAAIQVSAVQVIAHAVAHGDITLAQSLVESVPKHHKATLVAFLENFGPFKWDKDSKKLTFYRGNEQLKAACIKVPEGVLTQEYVDALPRWEGQIKASEPKSVYDVQEEAGKFIDRMRKLATKGTDVRNKELLQQLQAVYNRYVAKLDETNVSPEGFVQDPVHGEVMIPSLKDASQIVIHAA